MKVEYNYFKREESRTRHKEKLEAYIAAKDSECSGRTMYTPVVTPEQVLIPTPWGYFRVGAGNSKVHFPTINFESGLTCSSQDVCPFAYANKRAKKSKRPLCYAQKLEGSYTNMFNAKTYQALVCERIATGATPEQMMQVIKAVTAAAKSFGKKYVRVSEVGDIGPLVADFANATLAYMVSSGLKPYLYTKRPEPEMAVMRSTGAIVVVSERDFVCVASEEEAHDKGLPLCPGECGGPEHKCFRCPLGKQTAVIAH